MLVKDFIEWLKTQDQDAIVEVPVKLEAIEYYGDIWGMQNFSPEEHAEFYDLTNNPYVTQEERKLKYLTLGGAF